MNCREFHTSITSAVDRCLSRDDETRFQEHARQCTPCRTEYENELVTKLLVRNRVRMVQAPPALCRAIAARIRREDDAQPLGSALSSSRLTRRLVVGGGLALGAASVAVVLLLVVRTPPLPLNVRNTVQADVIGQSLANYQAMLAGAITPQVVSDRPDRVRAFFDGKTQFPVMVPTLRECTLVGGVLNDYAGAPLAHVVYRHGDKLLYVYQACWETVQRGETLQLGDHVRRELVRTGWFTEGHPDGRTVALWTEGRTLCAAVSSMTSDELQACLGARAAPPDGPGNR